MGSVLITGITGFVGSNLASSLVQEGYDVYGVVRHCAARNLAPIAGILDKVSIITGDISSLHSIRAALKMADPQFVIHLAALTPVRYSFEHPFSYEEANVKGTMNLVHAMLDMPDFANRKVVAASTAEVYGPQEQSKPFREELTLHPSSPYAVSKASAEMYLRMASEVYGLDCTLLRPCNTYGRKYDTGFIIEYLVTNMLAGKRVFVGAPDSVRDYIYVKDHVRAYQLALTKKLESGDVYNLGSGMGITNRDLASKIAEVIGYDPSLISWGVYPPGYPQRPTSSDQPYLVLNSERIKQRGWVQSVNLDEGLGTTVDYWRGQLSNSNGVERLIES